MGTPEVSFKQVVSRGCGLDVHKKVVVATIDGEGIKKQTREFGTVTSSLTELRDWLLDNGITHVAMESTGVFWKPVYNVLEPGGLTVWIVNAAHVKNVPGHKTDKKDSAWLCKLLLAGLLKPSYPRFNTLPDHIDTKQCLEQEPDHPDIGGCQHQVVERIEFHKRGSRHKVDRQNL